MTIRVPSSRLTQHNFSQLPKQDIPRSVFDRSFSHKWTTEPVSDETQTMDGSLYPVMCEEVLPGDTISLTATFLARLNPLVVPVMDNIYMDIFYFFCANRLVWDHWEEFISPGSSVVTQPPAVEYNIPVITGSPFTVSEYSVYDYLGLPLGNIDLDHPVTALPFRMINLIEDDWFRNQNTRIPHPNNTTGDGPDQYTWYGLPERARRHDYFTSCNPYPQKGDSVPIPIAAGAGFPVVGTGITLGLDDGTNNYGVFAQGGGTTMQIFPTSYGQPVGSVTGSGTKTGNSTLGITDDPDNSGMIALTSADYVGTINQLRQAVAFQQILELDERAGTRYVEHLKAHWGVISPDFRLQRPEYLGGYSERINITAIPQTSQPETGNPQGQLAGYGTALARKGIHYSAVEHGYLFCFVSFRSDNTYQQFLHKKWTRQTRFDFYLPALAHLGEQAVLQGELNYDPTGAIDPIEVFGYQERWAEYRYSPSYVTGKFRSAALGSLDSWHLALDLSEPDLGTLINYSTFPIGRSLAVLNQPAFLVDQYVSAKWARAMPVYSIPGLDRL